MIESLQSAILFLCTTPTILRLINQHLLRFAGNQLLHIGDTLLQDLLQNFRVLEFLGDFSNDAIGQFLLLSLLDLSLVSHPGIQDSLGFGGQRGLLFEFESLCFESGSLLYLCQLSENWVCV